MFPAVCEILATNIGILRKSCRGGGQTPPAASRVPPSTTQRAQEPGELSRWEQHRRDGWEASGGRWTRSGGHPHVRWQGLQVVRLLAERSIDVSAGRRIQLGANVCPHTAIATRPQRRSVDKNRTSTRCSTFAANRNSFCIGPMTRTGIRCSRVPSQHQMISRTPILARFQRFEQELHRQRGRPALHSWSTIRGHWYEHISVLLVSVLPGFALLSFGSFPLSRYGRGRGVGTDMAVARTMIGPIR